MKSKNLFPLSYQKEISDHEKKLAQLFLKNELDLKNEVFFQKSIERNKNLKRLGFFDQLICIGCGPIPSTLLAAAEFSMGLQFVGIDHDDEALILARQVVDRLGVNILLKSSLLETQLLGNRRLYYIANLVVGKKTVFEEILEKEVCKSGEFYIIVRDPTAEGAGNAENLRDKLDEKKFQFEILGEPSDVFKSQNYLIRF